MKLYDYFLVLAVVLAMSSCATVPHSNSHQIAGTVEDSQGQLMTNATVECYRYAYMPMRPIELEFEQRTRTDALGAFYFSVTNDVSLLLAYQDGLAPAARMCVNPPDRVAKERLILTEPGSLGGRLLDEAGQPVVDAAVWAFEVDCTTSLGEGQGSSAVLNGQPARKLFSARTTADGRFLIKGLPVNAEADLAASKPGLALLESALDPDNSDMMPFRVGEKNILLIMGPAGVIEGKVIQPDGEPLAGVKLWLQSYQPIYSADEGRQPVESGPDGTFRMTDVPANSYRISAGYGGGKIPDWVSEPVPVSVKAGQTIRDVTVLASKGGLLKVSVIDASTKKPLTKSYISASKMRYSAGASLDDHGIAWLRLPPGDYNVTAATRYCSPGFGTARVTSGRTNQIRFELIPSSKITGILRDPSGALATNVLIGLCGEDGSARTDANGRFEIMCNLRPLGSNRPDLDYCVVACDWRRNLAVAQDIVGTNHFVDLRLQPALVIAGKVVDEENKPVSDAWLKVQLHSRNIMVSDLDRMPARTDAQGRFELAALPPGRTYSVSIWTKGYGLTGHRLETGDTSSGRVELPAIVLKHNSHGPADK